MPHVEARIVDPETNEPVPVGEVGEFVTRGYHVMHGYFEPPRPPAAAAAHGGHHPCDGEGLRGDVDARQGLPGGGGQAAQGGRAGEAGALRQHRVLRPGALVYR